MDIKDDVTWILSQWNENLMTISNVQFQCLDDYCIIFCVRFNIVISNYKVTSALSKSNWRALLGHLLLNKTNDFTVHFTDSNILGQNINLSGRTMLWTTAFFQKSAKWINLLTFSSLCYCATGNQCKKQLFEKVPGHSVHFLRSVPFLFCFSNSPPRVSYC